MARIGLGYLYLTLAIVFPQMSSTIEYPNKTKIKETFHFRERIDLASSPDSFTPSTFALGLKACCRSRISTRAAPFHLSMLKPITLIHYSNALNHLPFNGCQIETFGDPKNNPHQGTLCRSVLHDGCLKDVGKLVKNE